MCLFLLQTVDLSINLLKGPFDAFVSKQPFDLRVASIFNKNCFPDAPVAARNPVCDANTISRARFNEVF